MASTERRDVPYARDADHRFLEILLALDALGRVQHRLARALRLGLGDDPAVAVQDRLVRAYARRRRERPARGAREAMAASERRCWWSH